MLQTFFLNSMNNHSSAVNACPPSSRRSIYDVASIQIDLFISSFRGFDSKSPSFRPTNRLKSPKMVRNIFSSGIFLLMLLCSMIEQEINLYAFARGNESSIRLNKTLSTRRYSIENTISGKYGSCRSANIAPYLNRSYGEDIISDIIARVHPRK
jgi:hypothetical protein